MDATWAVIGTCLAIGTAFYLYRSMGCTSSVEPDKYVFSVIGFIHKLTMLAEARGRRRGPGSPSSRLKRR